MHIFGLQIERSSQNKYYFDQFEKKFSGSQKCYSKDLESILYEKNCNFINICMFVCFCVNTMAFVVWLTIQGKLNKFYEVLLESIILSVYIVVDMSESPCGHPLLPIEL